MIAITLLTLSLVSLSAQTILNNATLATGAQLRGIESQHLDDCRVTVAGAVLTVGAPCRVRLGETMFQAAAAATATLSGTVSSGTVYVYWDTAGVLTAGHNTAATLTCNGNCTALSAVSTFPLGATPIGSAAFTNNAYTAVTDQRAALSGRLTACGTGMICAYSPGTATAAADATVMLTRATDQAGTGKWCRSTTGNDTYTCSLTPAIAAYTRGGCIVLDADTGNTGTATVAVNGLAAQSILNRAGGALANNDITANKPITLCHDGTQYIVQGDGVGGGGGGSVATDTLWDAKGDLAAATGADAAVRVAVGSNGATLIADSSQAAGVKWANVKQSVYFPAAGCIGSGSTAYLAGWWGVIVGSEPFVIPACGSGYTSGLATRGYIAFSASADQFAALNIKLPSTFVSLTSITYHHANDNTANTIVFRYGAMCYAATDSWLGGTPSFTDDTSFSDSPAGTAYAEKDTVHNSPTLDGCAAGGRIAMKIGRLGTDAADTNTGSTYLFGVTLEYLVRAE